MYTQQIQEARTWLAGQTWLADAVIRGSRLRPISALLVSVPLEDGKGPRGSPVQYSPLCLKVTQSASLFR